MEAVHELVIHPGRSEVKVKGGNVELTSGEFRLLHFLARDPGRILNRLIAWFAVEGSPLVGVIALRQRASWLRCPGESIRQAGGILPVWALRPSNNPVRL